MLKKIKIHPTEKGQSMVELAAGMVVLLVLLAGIIDLGRMLFFSIALRDSAQEGAVVGTLNPADCQNIRNRIRTVAGSGPTDTRITVNISYSTEANPTVYWPGCVNETPPAAYLGCAPNSIKVAVNSDFSFTMPFFSGRIIPLRSEITGTILRPACP